MSDLDKELLFDIQYALDFGCTYPRGKKPEPLQRKMMAAAILKHLKQSNWRFELGPPTPLATTAQYPR